MRGPRSLARQESKPTQRPRVLLLQGPVGPFFSDLSAAARRSGYDVDRFLFNPADRLFGSCADRPYRGGVAGWEENFEAYLDTHGADLVILFGSSRPGHMVARQACARRGVPLLSLEEGYVRPGFISAEWGGNNAESPLAGRMPKAEIPGPEPRGKNYRAIRHMALYGSIYYLLRSAASSSAQRTMFHRQIDVMDEINGWVRNAWKHITQAKSDADICDDLIHSHEGRYFLVPLQVPTDANLQGAACGWTVRRLVDATLASFAKSAPADAKLVFKIHPMARGHGRMEREIRQVATGNGIQDRVEVLETGALGRLTRYCAGMVTINSTSGLAAISHGKPLLVIGRAVYAHPALATCAGGKPDFDGFWTAAGGHSKASRSAFLAWLAREALLPGDFYSPKGRKVAISSILRKIGTLDLAHKGRMHAVSDKAPQSEKT